MVTVGDIVKSMERIAPPEHKLGKDPIGLHIGDKMQVVTKVMVTLDVLETVVDEAIAKGVNMIIAHHPLLYVPIKNIDTSTSRGRLLAKLLKHDIAVFAAHTNLDVAEGGVNDMLAQSLELQSITYLEKTTERYQVDYGIGRIGELAEVTTVSALSEQVKKLWDLPGVRFIGPADREIKTVAILGGDGNNYIRTAALSKADVLITGDIYYHLGHDAMELDFPVIDAGHTIEKIMINGLITLLQEQHSISFIASQVDTNPFNYR